MRRDGFTLVEVLAVLAILGLLLGITAVSVGKYRQAGRIAECQARIVSLSLLIDSYTDRRGDPPPSRLAPLGVTDANAVNEGIEALVVAFKHPDYAGRRPDEDWLANGDEDETQTLRLVDGSRALLEVVDPWGNPFVYIASRDYDQDFIYRFEGAADETARAVRDPLTGGWHRFESYQLRSVGPDGFLGTEDDLANYEIHSDEE